MTAAAFLCAGWCDSVKRDMCSHKGGTASPRGVEPRINLPRSGKGNRVAVDEEKSSQ